MAYERHEVSMLLTLKVNLQAQLKAEYKSFKLDL